MSKYTTELRFICETTAGLSESVGYDNIGQVIHSCHNAVIGNYPIFDENYRETLNTKILKHYYTREICEETVGLWKLRLNSRMNEIMPYYNKMYRSELLTFNPFYDTDISTSHSRNEDTEANSQVKTKDNRTNITNVNGETIRSETGTETQSNNLTRNTNTENNNERTLENETNRENHNGSVGNIDSLIKRDTTDKYSDTPQGGITGLESDEYLTNLRITKGEDKTEQNNYQQTDDSGKEKTKETQQTNDQTASSDLQHSHGKSTIENSDSSLTNQSETTLGKGNSEILNENNAITTETYLERVRGKRNGTSYSKNLMEYRETFLNIDKMVIEELNDLFFGLW